LANKTETRGRVERKGRLRQQGWPWWHESRGRVCTWCWRQAAPQHENRTSLTQWVSEGFWTVIPPFLCGFCW